MYRNIYDVTSSYIVTYLIFAIDIDISCLDDFSHIRDLSPFGGIAQGLAITTHILILRLSMMITMIYIYVIYILECMTLDEEI